MPFYFFLYFDFEYIREHPQIYLKNEKTKILYC